MRRFFGFIKHKPFTVMSILFGSAWLLGWLYMMIVLGLLEEEISLRDVGDMALIAPLLVAFIGGPVFLSLYNVLYLAVSGSSRKVRNAGIRVEAVTVVYGAFCTWLWAGIDSQIFWDKNWWEQLYNSDLHAPIATWTFPTVITLAAVGLAGYLVCRCLPLKKSPPLVTVLGIAGMYLGAALCVVWCIQLGKHDWVLCVYPVNLLLIFAKVIRELVSQWQDLPHEELPEKSPLLRRLQTLMHHSANWPWLGLVAAVPLLGVVIGVLALFGQAPDAVIQAWTQTSDWTFSQQIAPENLPMDTHYLCTVAAGGHRKVVKPLRMGMRHGHKVLVNRQLCVANAFEDLLQERLPRFHKGLRGFYDRYGYPIAKHIRSPYAADAVWLLMKPLEWFFLTVLYLFDVHPENRIAVQYPHSTPPKVK